MVLAGAHGQSGGRLPGLGGLGAMSAAWAMTHGFAMLAVDGGLVALLSLAPPGSDVFTLLEAAFDRLDVSVPAGR